MFDFVLQHSTRLGSKSTVKGSQSHSQSTSQCPLQPGFYSKPNKSICLSSDILFVPYPNTSCNGGAKMKTLWC